MAEALNQEVAALQGVLAQLNPSDQSFAKSLCTQFDKRGNLSEKQSYWVKRLYERATNPKAEQAKPERKVEKVGSMKGVVEMFKTAKGNNLKYPKIKLQLTGGQPIQLTIAGPNSKHPGTINITDGGPYGQNQWFGRVTNTGEYEASQKTSEELRVKIVKLLNALSRYPQQTAAAYGQMTGHCCFCSKELTDEKSTDVGYGPVCAKKYGLPHGVKS